MSAYIQLTAEGAGLMKEGGLSLRVGKVRVVALFSISKFLIGTSERPCYINLKLIPG